MSVALVFFFFDLGALLLFFLFLSFFVSLFLCMNTSEAGVFRGCCLSVHGNSFCGRADNGR